MESFQSTKTRLSNSLTLKAALITIIALLLLIPLAMIKGVIFEREETAQEVENSISNQFGNDQTLVGPVLNVPIEKTYTDKEGNVSKERGWIHIMPSKLEINAHLEPEVRYRGIYKTAVYNSNSSITGNFVIPFKSDDMDGILEWDKACLTIGISDNRGIRGDVEIRWNDQSLPTESGMITKNIAKTGFSVRTPLSDTVPDEPMTFAIDLELSGSKSFSILPIGQTSNILITSPG